MTIAIREHPELLEGRVARCSCGTERPSVEVQDHFFEYTGPGSREAEEQCKHCRYFRSAHDPEYMESLVHGRDGKRRPTQVEAGRCPGFEPIGPKEFDRFYDGCRGYE